MYAFDLYLFLFFLFLQRERGGENQFAWPRNGRKGTRFRVYEPALSADHRPPVQIGLLAYCVVIQGIWSPGAVLMAMAASEKEGKTL